MSAGRQQASAATDEMRMSADSSCRSRSTFISRLIGSRRGPTRKKEADARRLEQKKKDLLFHMLTSKRRSSSYLGRVPLFGGA